MVFEVATTLLLLNYTLSNFFVLQNGSISLAINQLSLPDTIFVDFGDGAVFDSNADSSTVFSHAPSNDSSILTVYHTFRHAGLYDVFVNLTNSVSGLDQWVTVAVEEKISGVELELLSSPVVELLNEVTVSCLVQRGSNLHFKWDFGDGSDGEQYTRMETYQIDRFKTNCTAYHSYGIANAYNVSVNIFNTYESITVYLNASIQAVEPIVELHLHPRIRGRYAAPLYRKKVDGVTNSSSMHSTAPVEFETGVWRGSDVQFLFDFGDGQVKEVSALLNAWSLPYAIVKHSYVAEGNYSVFVTATNLLSSVTANLERPFYVQFPPENLLLDRQYYIIEHGGSLALHSSISQGTNVSYNWVIGDMHMTDAGNTLFLDHLNPGIYIATVEALNQVTDFGYSTIRRPNTTAKIYVQEKLLGMQVCVLVNSNEICNPGGIDLPLDEDVKFQANVVPSTETVLRFIWQLGSQEIRRTNTPIFLHRYQQAGQYPINVTAQNHISSISSAPLHLNLVQKVANLTSIFSQGPNLVNHPITYRALYWFGTNLTFQWDFGDGSSPAITTTSSVQHTYKEVGEYWVSVNVWNKFSHANVTTNMFLLHDICHKPEITFLHPRNRIAQYQNDVWLEADISVNCKTTNVEYIWTVKKTDNTIIDFGSEILLRQRQLLVPHRFLMPGSYNIYLKVNMLGTIVYSESSTSLEVVPSKTFIYIEGGFMRWVGVNDTRELVTHITNGENLTQPLRYVWSCIPQIQKHLPCFQNTEFLHMNHSPKITISTSEIIPNVGAIIMNATVESYRLMSTSQVLEIVPVPHILHVDIECEVCHDHHVNQQDRIEFRATCKNCGSAILEYHWRVWIIEDGKFRRHFGNYECVQADGSTFFIIAPNSTSDENVLNTTYLTHKEAQIPLQNTSDDHMLAEKPYEAMADDLPPFPTLPGFPEENTTSPEPKLSRRARNIPEEEIIESPHLAPPPDYPYEGDADYEDNSTFTDFPYPDFMPFPAPDLSLGDPDYLITEEGMPGESGSAAARHQSSPNMGILLSEDEDQILEEAGKPRTKSSSSTNAWGHKSKDWGDPLRDGLDRKRPVPHIVSKPRRLLILNQDTTTTGLNSEYLILKPGVLKVGRSYLVQARISNSDAAEGSAMEYLKVKVGPFNGRCTLMPLVGHSVNFDFRLHCLEWKSDHLPLYYELSYSRHPDDLDHLIYFGLNGNVKFNLPSGSVSDSNNVYLNVMVRDSLGVSTKVCSIVRKVKPMQANISIESLVYNETFHPRSALKKLIGEKHNQAILHKLHVLASSLNDNESISSNVDLNPEVVQMRNKIRQGFLEIINDLKISSKIEAAQMVSVLSEIISDTQTMKLFELQKAYNIYKKTYQLQAELFEFFASDQMHRAFMVFLSKLAFAARFIHPINEELLAVSREDMVKEMNIALKDRLIFEEPLKVDIPHMFVTAYYITEASVFREYPVLLKNSAIQILDNRNLISPNKKCSQDVPNCEFSDKCFTFVAQEYDYVISPNQNLQNLNESAKCSVFLSLNSCNGLDEDEKPPPLNVSVYFTRSVELENITKIVLMKNYMNVHTVNITEKHIGYALSFYLKFSENNITEKTSAIDIMFRHLHHPTLTKFDMIRKYTADVSEMNVLIPSEIIKAPGPFYISVVNSNFRNTKVTTEVIWQYEASLWKDVCLGKTYDYWSSKNCNVLETINNNWTHCSCTVQEVTGFSVSLSWNLSRILIDDLMDPYFNPVALPTFLVMILIYVLLLYLNFQRDKMKNLIGSPIPLKDNNPKHKQLYLICLKTGYYFSSGSTASVFIVLHGTKDVTETRQLIGKEMKTICFQKGSVDVFLLSTERNLGPLLKLEIWHDNQGISPSWYLKMISIKDLNSGNDYLFNCYNWLSAEKGDGQIERELTVTENTPSLKKLLYENTIMFLNDLNMWNAVVWKTPVSYFTGLQRITCCLCFISNCALFLTLFKDHVPHEVVQGESLPFMNYKTILYSITCALVASILQIFYTILFRLSRQPLVEMNPEFSSFYYWLCTFSFNCWLKPKRSTSSHTTGRSASSMDGSDSMYSSFEESSIMSVPNLLEESSIDDDEKSFLPLSFSCPDVSDPVSPLQKTLSTWQTLENWLKKKQDLMIKPEVILMKRRSYLSQSSSNAIEEISELSGVENCASRHWRRQSASLSGNSIQVDNDAVSAWSEDIKPASKELDFIDFPPCLPPVFYNITWFLLILNVFGTSICTLLKVSRFSIPHCILLFKTTLISVIYSCLVITPVMILVFSFCYSLISIFVCEKKKPAVSLHKEKKLRKLDFIASSYSRIEYFKKYLRPPKEQVLELFRQTAIREKLICTFYSNVWNFIIFLTLLIAATYPVDIQTRYLQRSSIENVLFQSLSKTTKSVPSKYALLSWLEADFLDGFLAEHQCQDIDENCGISTRCVIVGNIILRHFYSANQSHVSPKLLNETNYPSHGLNNEYERRSLTGYNSLYYLENNWQVMTDQIFYSYDELHDFVENINSSSSAASIEFLLFNPAFSIFTSVSLLFEATSTTAVAVSSDILLASVTGSNNMYSYLKIFFNLVLLFFVLFDCKNQIWKIMKHKSQYLKQMWNYLSCLSILVYFIYLAIFVSYTITREKVAEILQATELSMNVNITEVARLENAMCNLVGILIFLHLLQLFKVLSFSERLKKLLRNLKQSQKRICAAIFIFSVVILSSVVMIKSFLKSSPLFSHPLFGIIKVATSLFNYYGRPEVTAGANIIEQSMSIFVTVVLITIHLYLFSIVRSVLLNHDYIDSSLNSKTATFIEMKNVIKKKILASFNPGKPQIVSQTEYVPPIDFLLYELERLADALVTKSNSLFPEKSNINNFLESEYELQLEKANQELGLDPLRSAMQACNIGLDEFDYESQDRLIATVPRRNKAKFDTFMPPSFHASLGSEKKHKTNEVTNVSLQNRIRKTYPLSCLDSDSSSSSIDTQGSEKLNSGSSLLVRKTKTRGKGRNEEFDLNIEASDHECV